MFESWKANKKSEHTRGYESAGTCILNGDSPQDLLNQAEGDCDPTKFTEGWRLRCEESICYAEAEA